MTIRPDADRLRHRARGRWWEVLAEAGVTLLVTREYEHLVLALSHAGDVPTVTFLPLAHPSGLAVDRERQRVFIAATRNPNEVYELAPVTGALPRLDVREGACQTTALVPVGSRFYPGSLYLHDLAIVAGALHGNAVGQNAVVRLEPEAVAVPVWWPACIDAGDGPLFGRNHIQLNSIAAGEELVSSFFSASTDAIGRLRPGHLNFPVDGRGVVFSGATREPVVRGLTRPHSARLHHGRVWVDDSGYGRLGVVDGGEFHEVTRLPGWTRGLVFHDGVAFVGTSRVLPRFRRYAPGLDVDRSTCAVHAVDVASGEVVGSITWPAGDQIFALELIPTTMATGLPFAVRRSRRRDRDLFYTFTTETRTQ